MARPLEDVGEGWRSRLVNVGGRCAARLRVEWRAVLDGARDKVVGMVRDMRGVGGTWERWSNI